MTHYENAVFFDASSAELQALMHRCKFDPLMAEASYYFDEIDDLFYEASLGYEDKEERDAAYSLLTPYHLEHCCPTPGIFLTRRPTLPEELSIMAYLICINPALPQRWGEKVSGTDYEKLLQIFRTHYANTEDSITQAFLKNDFAPALAEMERHIHITISQYYQEGEKYMEAILSYGSPNLFSWRKANWGTPYNIRNISVDKEAHLLSFTSVDGRLEPLFLTLSKDFPNVRFRYKWRVKDSKSCHYEVIQNGQMHSWFTSESAAE